ncbi:hypothetical protein NXS19_002447 [Fusarium pseudograminearum]|nr:hypothetical protein NXS19_002447 [Fusarium pseudograminearum]
MRDLMDAYDEEKSQSAVSGSKYSTYVAFLLGRDSQDDLQYWTSLLQDAEPCLLPPNDPTHDAGDQPTIKKVSTRIDDIGKLHQFRDKYGVSVASIFQLSWALVLAMQTCSRNVSFGNLSSGRDVPISGVQELVGPMINMLVCHLDLNWGEGVSEAARKLQSQSTEAFEHQRTSLAAIQHGLGLSRNQPLFNSTLSYKRQASTSSGRASSITLEGLTWEDPTEYDVHINIEASSTSIDINMQYSTAAFSETTTKKLVDSLVHAVFAVCGGGDRALGQLRLLLPAEEAKLCEWNSVIPPRVERCVHELVLDRMVSQPEALAVSAWDGDLTYAELNHSSYQLAHHLVAERGIGPEVMVGLCMDKSKWAIVAMIAVLRAGGTLVPLGVQEPFSRIEMITGETGTPLVLVDRHHEQRVAGLDTQLFTVDYFFDAVSPISMLPPFAELSATRPDHAAWVIFTSGSTGRPKGVVLEHGSVATSILAHGPAIGIQIQDRVSQFAAYTFDVSIAEIMTTLTFGACVCVPSEDDRTNRLTQFLSESEVSIATLTSTVAALVQPDKTPKIRTLVLTGEAVQPKVVDQWMYRATVINAYGPAESSIWTTGKVIENALDATNIGTPLAGAFWVVNPDSVGQLVHIGELLIESPLLARGYLNDPVKTAASFITNPELLKNLGLGIGSRRMYRTGDLVRQNQDGTITYLGRRDTQVKIRGQRVEIGEIEYHLRQQTGMQDAVVLYMNQGALAGRLIAFIVSSDTLAASHDQSKPQSSASIQRVHEEQNETADIWLKDVQQNLSQLVMHYMMPSVWIRLLAIPINASGKTDRLGLFRWVESLSAEDTAALTDAGAIEGEDIDELSATPIERELRQIWSEVLDVPISRVTYSTNFFSLGGDSITAMQVVSACRARGILVTVRKVLDCQTIPELAANSQTGREDAAHLARIPEGVFGLSPIQQMFFDEIAGDGLRADMDYRFNQAVSLYTTQRVEKTDLIWAINALVSKHAMLRARFRYTQDNAWQQWIEKDITGSYRFQDHTVADVELMQNLIEKSQATLDLEHGPVFAIDFIERQDRQGRQVLHLVAHHLVIDLVSWRILIRDLEELLVHHKLPNPTSLSFPVWLERQQDSLNRLVTETEEGADKSLEETLPVVVPNANWGYWGLVPGNDIYASLSTIEVQCGSATTSLLSGNANNALKTEPVDILLAALISSFQDVFADRSMPAVFTEGHGRETEEEEIDLSDTVSWFTTMVPVHVPQGAAKNAIEVLRKVKDQRRRLPGKGLPYFSSRYLTSHGREKFASHGPAEIIFNYLGRFQQLERDDALFHIEEDDTSASSQFGPLVKLFSVLDVSAGVEAGQLSIKVRFSRESLHQSAIEQWVKLYGDTVKTLVEELTMVPLTLTATDFPLARLSDSDWELIEGQYLKTEMGLSSTKEVEDILPCSAIQQGILLTQLQSPSTYCIHQTCRILPTDHTRPVSIQRLVVAWHQVVARHSIFRSVLVEPLPAQESFLQIVLREPQIDVQITDGEDIRDEEAVEWLASQSTLDITKLSRPPHRLIILKTNTDNVYCRFDVSHALVDASSVALILRDLIAGYEGELGSSGGSNYSDYVAFLENRQQHNDLQYWKSLLADAEPCLLPLQQPVHEASQAHLGHVIDQLDDMTMVHQFRDRHNVSIASICQLSWALVLANWTGSRNISFGNLSSGRDVPIPGVQELVGPMINMLVCNLFLDWDASTTIGGLARKLQSQSTESFEHQRASLASIQHELGFSKDQPLFNSTVSYRRQVSPSSDSKPAAIRLEAVVSVDPTEYDVHVNIDASSTSLEFNLQYSTAVLSKAAATRLAESLVQAVRIVAQNVDRPLRELTSSLLPVGDKLQLQEWNSAVALPVQRCVHELVSDRIYTLPEALAISSWDGDMTYDQLGDTSRRLASYLVEQGVGPKTMVGLCLDKSKWAIVGMLAVLFAGGAVVPLGVQHPVSRIRSIVEDTNAPIILVDDIHEKRLATMTAHTQLLSVESFFRASQPVSLQSGKSTVRFEDPAWIIYTSGSSGVPKGVVLQHDALATSILAHGPVIGVKPFDRLSQFAAYTFDVSIAEIMTALSFGACVCVPSEQDRMERLPSFLKDANITIATLTSTVAALIQEDIPTIRTMVLTGEAVQSKVVDRWVQQATVINAYGPSESSIWASCNIVKSGTDALNIGKPLAGAFWVANPDNVGQLVVRGAPGELLIEGPLLAREYLNDPEKTSTAFVSDPKFMQELGLIPGRRLYRTGDLVQQNEDATLTYLGRIDSQIKIRGQRVEVAEIESQIVRLLPGAREAVVDLVHPEGEVHDGPLILVAVIEHSDASPSLDGEVFSLDGTTQIPDNALQALGKLDNDLGSVLPPYMVPAAFLLVSKLPINASGKLDRRVVRQKLQSTSRDTIVRFSGSRDSIKAAPTTDLERKLQILYSTALRLVPEAVGLDDSFFKLGGDSVAAMKLTAVARAQNVSVSVADIFRWPRLADLSRVVEEKCSRDIGPLDKDPAPFSLWPELTETRTEIQTDDHNDKTRQARLLEDIATRCNTSADQIEDVYPCSPMQAGLMAITAQRPEAYVIQRVFKLHDDLSTQQLKDAWTRLTGKLSVLRTRIIPSASAQADALQVVIQEAPVWQDCRSLEVYLATDRATPITYGRALSRTAVVDDPAGRYFIWTVHHSIYDGWSVARTMEMLTQLLSGQSTFSPAPVSRFINYLVQQDKDQIANFWNGHFEGANWVRYPAIASPQYRAKPRDTLQSQMHVNLETGGPATMSTLLRAAWALLVATNTGANDAAINVVLSGRMAPIDAVMDVISPLVTTVPFYVSASKQQSVRVFLETIHRRATEMIPYEHTGLQNIRALVPGLGSEFDPGHTFVVQPAGESESADLPMFKMDVERDATSFDAFDAYALTVECTVGGQNPGDVTIEVRYDRAVLAVDTVQHLIVQLAHIVQQLAQNAATDKPLSELQLLTDEDCDQLREWNSVVPPRLERCLHDLILETMTSYPTAPAISSWDGEMTYSELNDASQYLAYHLVDQGIGPEVMVGLCMDKSRWAVVAILAILRAGGVVVPLGIQQPLLRIEGIIQDTSCPLILVDRSQEHRLASLSDRASLFSVSSFFDAVPTPLAKSHNLSTKALPSVKPDHSAYVIFTSGSTGVPKGIILEHGALATSIIAHGTEFGMDIKNCDRVLQFAAYTFDVAIQDIIATLSFGACLCIPSEHDRMNRLVPYISEAKVTFAILTPTVAALIQPQDVPSIRTLISGGEALPAKVVDQWIGHANIINGYGPSECSIHSTCHKVQHSSEASIIGRGITAKTWVIDSSNSDQLVPIGAIGELIIEGPLLARGYLNDPLMTANSFITDPAFVQQLGFSPNRRMYRTGDLVQQNMDGSLVYLGRRDTQVKIRGQRVEVGEIESHILDLLPNAREAIVDVIQAAAEDQDVSPMLVAVIETDVSDTEVLASDTQMELYSPSQITQKMREGLDGLDTDLGLVLPAYMVPTVYLLASKLPLNASGKLDRRAVRDQLMLLPRHVLSSFSGLANSKQMPTTPMEQKLQTLYTSVLALKPEAVGISDSFFRLGGDSVAAMKLTAAAHAQGIPLTVADIFQWPRLADLAEAMEEKGGYGSSSAGQKDPEPFSLWPELQKGATEKSRLLADVAVQCGVSIDKIEDVYPCSPLQAGLMTITAQRPEAYVVQRVFKLQGGISTQTLKAAWTQLITDLPILRTRIIPSVQATALQVVLRETPIWQAGISLEDYLTADRAIPMIYGGALSRTAILEDGSHRHFIWTVHHSIYDGWSMAKTMEMLEGLLSGSTLSHPVSVPVSRFIGYLTQKDKDQTAMFWQKHLEGANWTRYPELPSQQHIINPRVTSHRRLRIPKIAGSTTFIVLRAAWALLVASKTGADEAVINVVLSGRAAPVKNLLHLVAPTITTVPFHVSTSTSQSIRDFLDNIQGQATDMIPHEHTGLQNIRRMVSSLGPDFDPGHIFVVQPAAEMESTVANSHLQIEREASSMDAFHAQALTIECTVGHDTRDVEVELRFDDAVIAAVDVEQLLDQFNHLVQQLAENADKKLPLDRLQLLSPGQMAQICRWNSSIPSRVDRCIHELVMDQMTTRPAATAVTACDGDLTYRQLDDLSFQLALHLIETGIGPEVIVGVCMSKSKWAVVAMLAVLRAGGVVVPLGTRQPLGRIETIITDTAAPLILADRPQEQQLKGLQAPTQLLVVESFFEKTAKPAQNTGLQVFARSDNAAWIIYTSGSTGTPKGVVLEHGALATSILGHGKAYGLQSDDRILQFAAYTFDAAIQEIMTTLAFGACICIPSEQDRVERLTSYVAENRITMATLTSTVAALVRPRETPTVRTIILVGEAVQANVVDQWLQQAKVINGYGPSECSIASTCREIQNSSSALNIGTAIAGGLWVVKPSSTELAAFGSPGELLIDGPLLARGYLNDPTKTAASFITDTVFLKDLGLSGRRLYRTGDLVQQNRDGSLTYLGRIDTQIKIRGQRVEIGEIESQIEKHPTVRDAVVLYPRQGPLANRLVATVVLGETSTDSQSTTIQQISQEYQGYANTQFHELQRILSENLVYYMIPSVWVPLAAVPVNTSGKTDRLAISRWVQSLTEDEVSTLTSEETEYIDEELTTTIERQLRQIWSEVLDVPLHKITYTTTKFFSLGGDSITAMQVVSACRARGILVTVRKALDYQTIRELATQTQTTENSSSITKIPEGNFQLSPIQQMYFADIAADGIRADGEYRFNQGVTLHVTRQIDWEDLAQALDAIVSKHAMLRARFSHSQNGWHQWVEKHVPASYRLCKHTASDSRSMQDIIEHSQVSLDLEHGPVFAADLIHRPDMQKEDGQDGQVLHFVAHHLVIDLMSWRILLQDLETLLVYDQPLKMDILSFPYLVGTPAPVAEQVLGQQY